MADGAVPAYSISDTVEKVAKNAQVPKGWAVVGADGVKKYVTGETTKQAAKRTLAGNAVKKGVGAVSKALPVLEGMNALGSQNYNTFVATNSKGKKVSLFGDTFSGKANMDMARSLVNSGKAKNIEEAKNMVAEMGGAKSISLFDDESWNDIMGIPNEDFDGMDATPHNENFDGMDATPPKEDTIDNNLESQANAKQGDVVNGKTLTQGDINWAKEQMAKLKQKKLKEKKGKEKEKKGKQKMENKTFQENLTDKKKPEFITNNNKQEDSKERKTSMMPIISKIVGGLLGGKWGAFGDEHSQLGQSIADAGRMAGYTQGELDMKDADISYQKEFEKHMASLDIQKQRNITKAMADLFATDPNSKEYMNKQFELQKELQREGFSQNLISQFVSALMTAGGFFFYNKLKSDSRTKLKYCLDK